MGIPHQQGPEDFTRRYPSDMTPSAFSNAEMYKSGRYPVQGGGGGGGGGGGCLLLLAKTFVFVVAVALVLGLSGCGLQAEGSVGSLPSGWIETGRRNPAGWQMAPVLIGAVLLAVGAYRKRRAA